MCLDIYIFAVYKPLQDVERGKHNNNTTIFHCFIKNVAQSKLRTSTIYAV